MKRSTTAPQHRTTAPHRRAIFVSTPTLLHSTTSPRPTAASPTSLHFTSLHFTPLPSPPTPAGRRVRPLAPIAHPPPHPHHPNHPQSIQTLALAPANGSTSENHLLCAGPDRKRATPNHQQPASTPHLHSTSLDSTKIPSFFHHRRTTPGPSVSSPSARLAVRRSALIVSPSATPSRAKPPAILTHSLDRPI